MVGDLRSAVSGQVAACDGHEVQAGAWALHKTGSGMTSTAMGPSRSGSWASAADVGGWWPWLTVSFLVVVLAAGCTSEEGEDGFGAEGETESEEEVGGETEGATSDDVAGTPVRPRGGEPSGDDELAADQTLRIFAFTRAGTFDPAKQSSRDLGRQYLEPLLKPAPGKLYEDEEVTGAAAEDYEVSDDGLTWTFQLRDDNRYSNGEPVRAQDFVYAWKRLVDPRVASPYGRLFAETIAGGDDAGDMGPEADADEIDAALDDLGLAAPDEQTFEVTLSRALPYFEWIATLWVGAPIPQGVADEAGDAWGSEPDALVTNGPFQLTEVTQQKITFERNPHYPEEPHLDRIEAFYGLGANPRWVKYLDDELDMSNGPPGGYDVAIEDPEHEDDVIRYPEPSIQWLQFNTQQPPFDDPQVRRAFAQAIDRAAYQDYEAASEGIQRPATTLVPKGIPGFNPELGGPQEFEPDRAAQTLEDAVDADQLDGIEILTFSFQEPDALFFQDQFEQHLGIDVAINSIDEGATVSSKIAEGDYQIATTFIGHLADYPDPHGFFDIFLSSSPDNEFGWSNAEYDRLVQEANVTADPDERLALLDDAQEILVEEAPVAFVAQLERVMFVKPWVRGIVRTPLDGTTFPGNFYSTTLWLRER